VTYRDEFHTPVHEGFEGPLVIATIPLKNWLLIEFFTFYGYMGSAIMFIARHQIKAWYNDYSGNPQKVTDIKKQMTDFIIYQDKSLTWFALNLVCCIMPPIVVMNAMTDSNGAPLTTSAIVMTALICL